MKNDEIKRFLDDAMRLASYTWKIDQRSGEPYLDTPANHILVKNVDECAALLLRRGYRLQEHQDKDGVLYKFVYGDGTRFTEYAFRESFFLYETVATVAERLDQMIGQHHLYCAQCQEPLLGLRYTDQKMALKLFQAQTRPLVILEVMPGREDEVTYRLKSNLPISAQDAQLAQDQKAVDELIAQATITEYRSAKAGPNSERLTVCPGCQVMLSAKTVQEIVDVN